MKKKKRIFSYHSPKSTSISEKCIKPSVGKFFGFFSVHIPYRKSNKAEIITIALISISGGSRGQHSQTMERVINKISLKLSTISTSPHI